MGRVDNFKTRGRNRGNRARNPLVVIACEGKNKTEETYFKNFNSRNCIIKFLNKVKTSQYSITNNKTIN